MAEKDRSSLKEFFETGARPTEEDFSDLIDSFVSKKEDGLGFSSSRLVFKGDGPRYTVEIQGDALVGKENGESYTIPSNGLSVAGGLAVDIPGYSGSFSLDVGGNGRFNGVLRVGDDAVLNNPALPDDTNTRLRVDGITNSTKGLIIGTQRVINDKGEWVGPSTGIAGQDGQDGDSFFTESGNTASTTKNIGLGIQSAQAKLHINAGASRGILISSSDATSPAIQISNATATAKSDGATLKISDGGNLIISNSTSGSTGKLSLSPQGSLGLQASSDRTFTLGGSAVKTQGSGTFLTPADSKVMAEENADPFNGVDVTAILKNIVLKQYKYNGKFSTEDTETPILPDLSAWPTELNHLKKPIDAIIEEGGSSTTVETIDSGELIYYLIQAVQELSNRIQVLEDAAPQPGG